MDMKIKKIVHIASYLIIGIGFYIYCHLTDSMLYLIGGFKSPLVVLVLYIPVFFIIEKIFSKDEGIDKQNES